MNAPLEKEEVTKMVGRSFLSALKKVEVRYLEAQKANEKPRENRDRKNKQKPKTENQKPKVEQPKVEEAKKEEVKEAPPASQTTSSGKYVPPSQRNKMNARTTECNFYLYEFIE